ncbi:PE domain-containing protein [Nocardia alni]|uniref:PE domain-containing protein n=1 Tax=Nocardia alni TaxID=2815723 RepID=UPI001C2153C7|nr:PE domain-containing protein [Nocardia alni]
MSSSSVGVTPDQLPIIGAQVAGAMAEALQSITAAAPLAICAPPGSDFVSPQLTAVTTQHAAAFFPSSLQGIGYGTDAAAVLPTIGADYALTDVLGECEVIMQSAFQG